MSAVAIANPLDGRVHGLGLSNVVLSTCAINVLSLALPIATLQVYDRVLHGQNLGTLQMLMVGAIMALVIETFLRLVRSYVICQRGAAYAHGVSCAAMNAQLDARIPAAAEHAIATDLGNLNAVKSIKDFKSGYSLIVLIDLMFVPVFIIVMAYISQALVLVPIALLCLFGLITAMSGLKVRGGLEHGSESDDKRYEFLINSLTSSQLMKSYAMEMRLQRRFEKLHRDSCAASYWLSRSITESVVHGAVLGHLMTAATVTVGAYMAVQDQLSVGALIAVVQLSSRLMQPLQKAILLWVRFQDYQSAKVKVDRLFDVPLQPVRSESAKQIQNVGRVEVDSITFRPRPNAPLLIDGLSMSLEAGQAVILDGVAGSGKSALLKIIAGLYAPTSGIVRINGVDAATMPSDVLARQVGYLAPRATFFRGTIGDNITRFNEVPIAQALSVARMLGLKAEFDQLPLGIDTVAGSGTETNLSPGLVQMISMLRVLSSKPRILLFDDADNGLDSKYYNSVISLLGKLKPSVAMVIVSRDMNIRQLGDRLVTLVDGRLVESETNSRWLLKSSARI